MKTKIVAVLVAVLSFALGGCPTTGVRTTTTVYTAPVVRAHEHHHETLPGKVVSETTTVETERHGGAVVKKTTVVVRKRAVDCSDRNPYRDEYTPSSPCYWKKHVH
jgi:hypothetical protein